MHDGPGCAGLAPTTASAAVSVEINPSNVQNIHCLRTTSRQRREHLLCRLTSLSSTCRCVFTNILNVPLEFLLRSAVEQSLRLCSSSLLLRSAASLHTPKSSSLSTYLYIRRHNNLSLSCLIDPCEVIQHREATCQGLLSQRTPSLGRSGRVEGGAVSDLTHSSPESQCLLFSGEETKHKPSDELPYEPPSAGCS